MYIKKIRLLIKELEQAGFINREGVSKQILKKYMSLQKLKKISYLNILRGII